MTISIEELQEKLKSISADMLPVLKEAMTDAAMVAEGRSKELCPVITGTLRRSISSRAIQKGNEVRGILGANTTYAEAVELGTSKRAPHPYLLPAIEEKQSEIVDILSSAVEEAIKKHTRP